MINDNESLVSACYVGSGTSIPVYDDGFGPLWIHRDSMGVSGIVRARNWYDAYGICEDEFFPEADESVEDLIKEYGFRREHVKIISSSISIPENERPSYLGAYEKVAEPSDYTDNGRLPDGLFLRWHTIETPDPDAWVENDLFNEAYGFRPNGIYQKDLNGDYLDPLTPELCESIGISLEIAGKD